jgi:hypothetical protein
LLKRPGMKLRALLSLAVAVSVLPLASARADLDCSTRLPEHDDPAWTCVKASSFGAACIPASAFTSWRCLELDRDATFCKDDEPFHTTVYLTTNDVSLDCANQAITHDASERKGDRSGVRAPYARSVSGIALRNCNIHDVGSYGVDLHRFFRGAEVSAPRHGHSEISLENVHIQNSARIGVYVGQASHEVALDQVVIDHAYIGVYLESESTHTRISDAIITNSFNREGIALDSSQYNLIEHSHFSDNAGGAIMMYKNCGELNGQICPISRPLSASYNTVRFSEFYGNHVEVASRQFKAYTPGHCQDAGLIGIDHADHNLILSNYFENTRVGIMDTDNIVYDNELSGSTIELGKTAPVIVSPVDIAGTVAENTLGAGSDIKFDALLPGRYEDLQLFNNHTDSGVCWKDNKCAGPTVWLGKVLSAGVLAVLFR